MPVIRETAHQLGTDPQLTGILSLPEGGIESAGKTGVIMLSSGLLHRVGPFRLHVDLARSLARHGIASVRVDQSGRGDSNRSTHLSSLDTIQEEVASVAGFFSKSLGIDNIILLGLCSGADDTVLLTKSNEFIRGIVLLDGFAEPNRRYQFHYYMERLLDAGLVTRAVRNRVKRLFQSRRKKTKSIEDNFAALAGIRNFPDLGTVREAFAALFERDGHALAVFTGGVKDYYGYAGQLRHNLGLPRGEDRLSEVFYPTANHTYPINTHRDRLVRLISRWCGETFD